MKAAFLAVSLIAMAGSSAAAAIVPMPGTGDPHIQTVDYDAQQVIELRVAPGYALTLEFSPDERIENVALGNSAVWQVTPNKSADHLFIKPVQGATDTDMTVITDARSYNFELKPASPTETVLPFLVRILYPAASTVVQESAKAEGASYRFGGARELRPIEMTDDGLSTSIVWSPKSPIPAVYAIDQEGHERLVNGAMRHGRYVIDQVANQFVFRLGSEVAKAVRHPVKGPKP